MSEIYYKVDHDNETGPGDDNFWEWWAVIRVTSSDFSFNYQEREEIIAKCDTEEDADLICELLNKYGPVS